MKRIKLLSTLILAAGLSACGSIDTVTRSAPMEAPVLSPSGPVYSVVDLQVTVPTDLKVSEANLFFPVADIVWRGDAPGNRYQQVQAIFDAGMRRGAQSLTGSLEVNVEIEVMRFHSLTEKTRYTSGGIHSIKFMMAVYDAITGEVLMAPRVVKADLEGFGGSRAIAAEQNGLGQKVRIENHLANVIVDQLNQLQV